MRVVRLIVDLVQRVAVMPYVDLPKTAPIVLWTADLVPPPVGQGSVAPSRTVKTAQKTVVPVLPNVEMPPVAMMRHAPIALMIVEAASPAAETDHVDSSKTVPIVPRTAGPANRLAVTMCARPMRIASRAQQIAVSASPIFSAGMETAVLGNRAVAARRTVEHVRTHAEMGHV